MFSEEAFQMHRTIINPSDDEADVKPEIIT